MKTERELAFQAAPNRVIRVIRGELTVAIELSDIVNGEYVVRDTILLDPKMAAAIAADMREAARRVTQNISFRIERNK